MYEITIISDEILNKFTIEELKELKEILESFQKIDEFYLERRESDGRKVKSYK